MHALLRERRHERIQAPFERGRDLQCIGAVLSRGLNQDARSPADHGVAETGLGRVAHRGHIADAQGAAVAHRNHRLRQRRRSCACGLCLQHDPLRGRLDVAAADQLRAAARRDRQILKREACPEELVRIHEDLPLARLAAEYLRLRNAGHAEDLRLDRPAHEVTQLNG